MPRDLTTARFLNGVVAAALMTTGSLQAHHSIGGVYDVRKEAAVSGTFTGIRLVFPHGSLHLAVENPDGSTTSWVFTTGAPRTLADVGITKGQRELNPGDTITVKYFPSRNGSPLGFLRSIRLADGRVLEISAANTND
jgi:hypothetical protein